MDKPIRSFILFTILGFFLITSLTINSGEAAQPAVRRTALPNKLVLLLREEHSLPFVTILLLFDAGSRSDPRGQEGLARLTSKALLLGTSKRTAPEISNDLDFMGASLDSSAGKDTASLSLRVLKKDLDKGLALFMEVLREPTFKEDELKREVTRTIAAIKAAEDDPGHVAEKAFNGALFPENPYGHPVEGTKESLEKITTEDVKRFYGTYYRPNNGILTIVGDITEGEVKALLYPALEAWQSKEITPAPFQASYTRGPETVNIDRSITQANIILGTEGVSRENPDYYPLTVMNYILGGGGFASRLVEEIRNKRGLAYSVASFFDPGRYPGTFQIVLQTKNASARESIDLALKEIERIQREPVSEKELEGARKYLIGSFPLRFDTQSKLASFLTLTEYFNLGLDYVEKYPAFISAVTTEDIQRVAKKYLPSKAYVLVVVGNLKETGTELPEKGK
jgi:zinc protease